MSVTRRVFLRNGAMAVIGGAMVPPLLTRTVLAQTDGLRRGGKRLVVIFQRGAADGLNMVIPYGEVSYYQQRSSIAVPRNEVLDLDGFFGLHPALSPLKPFWDQKELAIVHACGSPDPTRSHFDAQDYMESGTPGVKSTTDGWLNRALAAAPAAQPVSAFRAIAAGATLPRTLEGRVPALAIDGAAGPGNLGVRNDAPRAAADRSSEEFAAMYAETSNTILRGTGREMAEAERTLKAMDATRYVAGNGASYPRNNFGDSMQRIAQLMKADLGVEVAFAEMGGWDTHQNQGGANGQMANRLREWADGIAAFRQDMGRQGDDVVVVTMSEFGRTLRQNGTGGTDHGHANAMFVLGAPVAGGKVYGKWPGLAAGQLNEDRDLAVTTDFRQVLAAAAAGTLRPSSLSSVFPDMPNTSIGLAGILKV